LTQHGNIKYGAPEGKHDDCVISLALANWGMRPYLHEAQVVKESIVVDNIDRQGQGTLEYDFAEHENIIAGNSG